MNWDVTLDTVNRRISICVIMRDHEGCALAAKSTKKLVLLEPVAAEVLAALRAGNFLHDPRA